MAFLWDAIMGSQGALKTQTSTFLPNETKTWGTGYADPFREINIDASRSSEVYGNSTTIQPNSVTTRFYIKF